ncbi:MAG: aminopeptidase N [Parvicellaceae bacterium]
MSKIRDICVELVELKMMRRLGLLTTTAVLAGLALSGCKTKAINDANGDGTDSELIDKLLEDEKNSPIVRPVYQPSEKRVSDILHTKLEVSFLWDTKQLKGQADLTIKPHFFDTDSLTLDAKAIEVSKVVLMNGEQEGAALTYKADGHYLKINLGKEFTRNDQYTIRINYIANPEKVTQKGSAAISSAKGLYFINADESDEKKPMQIWTQGETEAGSCWFPTIDSPNEKTTQEMYITVDEKYKTLSNGLLVYSTPNSDGTRTDYWKMDQPHSPYLFMMAVGDFALVEDKWTKKDGTVMAVNYYVEKEFEEHAKAIFGKTPKMLSYFSDLLGVEYQWDKYSQVVVRDYVSGAMENTTATIHGEFLHQTKREIIDGGNESIIAHELFHHWFGDLVTCESWANLPLNESFANYSQFLWDEYEHGQMEADMNAYSEMEGYLLSSQQQGYVDMIRYDYGSKEEMFDANSYNKGGRILHMLRSYVGDDAFFASLKKYLTDNAFSNAEIHDLRKAFEATTGEDLNWFFNQWFLAGGHPKLVFNQSYDATSKKLYVYIDQNQNMDNVPLYKLPIHIDIYVKNKKNRHIVWAEQVKDTFVFDLPYAPQLVNIDAQKVMLCDKVDKKPTAQWIYQMNHAPLFLDKKEALAKLGQMNTPEANDAIIKAYGHPFWKIKAMALNKSSNAIRADKNGMKAKVISLTKDEHPAVRKAAILILQSKWKGDMELIKIYENALTDSSYSVMSQGMDALGSADKKKAMAVAKSLENDEGGAVRNAIARVYAKHGGKEEHDFFLTRMDQVNGMGKYGFLQTYNTYLMRQDQKEINKGIEIFEDVARNGNPWFLKLAGYQLLRNAAKTFGEIAGEQKLLHNKYMDEGATMKAASAKQDQIKAENQAESIKRTVEAIRMAETDANVLQYLDYKPK